MAEWQVLVHHHKCQHHRTLFSVIISKGQEIHHYLPRKVVYEIVKEKKIANEEMTGSWELALAAIEAGKMP